MSSKKLLLTIVLGNLTLLSASNSGAPDQFGAVYSPHGYSSEDPFATALAAQGTATAPIPVIQVGEEQPGSSPTLRIEHSVPFYSRKTNSDHNGAALPGYAPLDTIPEVAVIGETSASSSGIDLASDTADATATAGVENHDSGGSDRDDGMIAPAGSFAGEAPAIEHAAGN